MEIQSSISTDGNVLTIKLGERFDFSMVQQFQAPFQDVPASVSQVNIDLSSTLYIDSTGLGMLINMKKKLSGQVSDFCLIHATPGVLKILGIAKFEKQFTLK